MGSGLFGWQSASLFAWCGVSAPLQGGTVHFGRTEPAWWSVVNTAHKGEGGGGACREKRRHLCFLQGPTR